MNIRPEDLPYTTFRKDWPLFPDLSLLRQISARQNRQEDKDLVLPLFASLRKQQNEEDPDRRTDMPEYPQNRKILLCLCLSEFFEEIWRGQV